MYTTNIRPPHVDLDSDLPPGIREAKRDEIASARAKEEGPDPYVGAFRYVLGSDSMQHVPTWADDFPERRRGATGRERVLVHKTHALQSRNRMCLSIKTFPALEADSFVFQAVKRHPRDSPAKARLERVLRGRRV